MTGEGGAERCQRESCQTKTEGPAWGGQEFKKRTSMMSGEWPWAGPQKMGSQRETGLQGPYVSVNVDVTTWWPKYTAAGTWRKLKYMKYIALSCKRSPEMGVAAQGQQDSSMPAGWGFLSSSYIVIESMAGPTWIIEQQWRPAPSTAY